MIPDEQSRNPENVQNGTPDEAHPPGTPQPGPAAAGPGPNADAAAANPAGVPGDGTPGAGASAGPTGGTATSAPPAGGDAAPAPDARDAEIEALRSQVAELNDRYIRAMAEMENVRRRSAEEVAKARKFALESFAEALIPVMDSLEMALKVETQTVESLREGTEATLRQLETAFDRNHLRAIDPAGERFDPNVHQAISMVPASQTNPPVKPQHVASVLQRGYLIHERVLRPALVMVAQG